MKGKKERMDGESEEKVRENLKNEGRRKGKE